MATLNDVRHGLSQAWQNLAEGWQQLRDRASHALTRFNPRSDKKETEGNLLYQGARWGLLTSDVEESAKSITVRLEAPGMEKEDFDISVYDDVLLVKGVKHAQREQEKGNYHILECAYGEFERAIPLPAEVDESSAKAKYKRGVLTIQLPKKNHSPRTRINIQAG